MSASASDCALLLGKGFYYQASVTTSHISVKTHTVATTELGLMGVIF